jgi:hypothetical protein
MKDLGYSTYFWSSAYKDWDDKLTKEEVVDEAKAYCQEGDWVNVFSTSYIGKVVGFNERTSGFYPGDRYPVFIKIIKDISGNKNGAEGCTFEYGLYFVKKLDNLTELDDDYLFGFMLGRTKWTKEDAIEMFELEHENKASTQFINGWTDANKHYVSKDN